MSTMWSAVIRFKGAYRFLSNFYPARVKMGEIEFPTVEHAYQAAKTVDETERREIAAALTPGKAKRHGREVTLRPDWERIKIQVMLELLRQKFRHPELGASLRLTGDAVLVKGNNWHDCEWGACFCNKCLGTGDNMLGQLLMQVREEIS